MRKDILSLKVRNSGRPKFLGSKLERAFDVQLIYEVWSGISEDWEKLKTKTKPPTNTQLLKTFKVSYRSPELGNRLSKSSIFNSHMPIGSSPQWKRDVIIQSVKFLNPVKLSTNRFRVIGDVVLLGALNCRDKSPRREKLRLTLICTCSRNLIAQSFTSIETIPGIFLKRRIAKRLG